MIFSVFDFIDSRKKLLMVPRFNYKGVPTRRQDVSKWLKWRLSFLYKMLSRKFLIGTRRLSQSEVSCWVAASDLIFIARKELLNSGQLYLGLTLNKSVVAPYTGNLIEGIKHYGFSSFHPHDSFRDIAKVINGELKKSGCATFIDHKSEFNKDIALKYRDHFASLITK